MGAEEYCSITFIVVVDETGEIVRMPEVVRAKTTTSDTVLIKQVAALLKAEAKFNPIQGASTIKKEISIIIEAQ